MPAWIVRGWCLAEDRGFDVVAPRKPRQTLTHERGGEARHGFPAAPCRVVELRDQVAIQPRRVVGRVRHDTSLVVDERRAGVGAEEGAWLVATAPSTLLWQGFAGIETRTAIHVGPRPRMRSVNAPCLHKGVSR